MIKISKVFKEEKVPFMPYQIIIDVDTAMVENDLGRLFRSLGNGMYTSNATDRDFLHKIGDFLRNKDL